MTVPALRYAAFTQAGTGGNPAGVVLEAAGLRDAQMLAIAQEVGYSETAFVLPESVSGDPRRLRVRYFSPVAEVAFCGHATIATAVAIAEREGPGRLHLTTMAGPVTVDTSRDDDAVIMATLTSPPARTAPVQPDVLERALCALRWSMDDLDPGYPVHVAHAGNDHLVLATATLERLAAFEYDYSALEGLMSEQGWTTVHAFWAETPTSFRARNAFPPGGVVEDPATGAAAAAFGGYLRTLGLAPVPGQVVIRQGEHMGAPSRLLVDLESDTETIRVTGTATELHNSTATMPTTHDGPVNARPDSSALEGSPS